MAATPTLDGILVLDFATVGPAARCSRILADYGATVVKIGAPPSRAGVQIEPEEIEKLRSEGALA